MIRERHTTHGHLWYHDPEKIMPFIRLSILLDGRRRRLRDPSFAFQEDYIAVVKGQKGSSFSLRKGQIVVKGIQ